MSKHWDVIIVGGGVAGLSAALLLGRARRRVLVVDAGSHRNRFAAHMHGVLGQEGTDPAELIRRGRDEVSDCDVTVRDGSVTGVVDDDLGLRVSLADGDTPTTRALIVATGLTDRLPDIPGIDAQWGTRVLHCPYCHGWEVRDRRLAVLGTSPMSLHQAELIRQWSHHVVFLTAALGAIEPQAQARLWSRGVELIDVPVTEVVGDGDGLTGVRLADGRLLELDAMFVSPRPCPHDGFLDDLGLRRAGNPVGSFIDVDATGQTSHPRIWAIGNVVSPFANVPISIGAGAMTGGAVNMALVTEDFDLAVAGGAEPEESAADHWENQYAERERRWSGRANPTMTEVVSALPDGSRGDVLELGCGEGGDAVWLAEHGWRVTAVDISASATTRAAAGAAEKGVGDRITWVTDDLTTWTTDDTFDLVTATFFHSAVALPRTRILRRAADRIRPGGHMLIISHVFENPGDIPPWAGHHHGAENDDTAFGDRIRHLLTPAQELAELALEEHGWEVVTQQVRTREATGPDGHQTASVKDGVVLLRRTGANAR